MMPLNTLVDPVIGQTVRPDAMLDANPRNTAISTYTGKVFDILNRDEWNFDRFDIAHALSHINRFAGHVDFYSVAEHSIRVAEMLDEWGVPPLGQLYGLLHDASEAYLLDIPRPWKAWVGIWDRSYYEVEDEIQHALLKWAGLGEDRLIYADVVKEADMGTYEIERDSRPSPSIMVMPPKAMRSEFLWHWNGLEHALDK